MTFTWPWALAGLLLVPALAAMYVWAQRSRRIGTLRYSSVGIVREAYGTRSRLKRHLPAVFYLLALAALFFGLSRPKMEVPNPQRSGTVILALDISGSMRTEDVKPSRIQAAVLAIEDFVNKQHGGIKIGLVGFADSAQLMVAPTEDKKPLLAAVRNLRLQRGTNIGDGLQVALKAITQDYGPDSPGYAGYQAKPLGAIAEAATIVLLSDGAATTGPAPLKVADEIAPTGVKVFTVGLGVPSGGRGGFMELDEPTLRGIAEKTGGMYFTAQNLKELRGVYDELSLRTSVELKTTEITAFAVAASAVLMLLAGAMGLFWFNRLP